jgi:hypothetical protein
MQITIGLCATIRSNITTNTQISPMSWASWVFVYSPSLGPIRSRVAIWQGFFRHWKDQCPCSWHEKHKPFCLWSFCSFSLSLGGAFDVGPTLGQGFQTFYFPLWA